MARKSALEVNAPRVAKVLNTLELMAKTLNSNKSSYEEVVEQHEQVLDAVRQVFGAWITTDVNPAAPVLADDDDDIFGDASAPATAPKAITKNEIFSGAETLSVAEKTTLLVNLAESVRAAYLEVST